MAQPNISNGIHRAAYDDHVGKLQRLLATGSSVDERDSSGTTPLMLSSAAGHKRCIKILLKSKASVSAIDVEGLTALHRAADGGHLAATNLLVAAGANLYAPCHNKQVPFHYAAISGKVRVMRAMVLAGMDVNYHTSDGPTALYCAVGYNQIEAVTYLLQEGANPAIGVKGFTPLDNACRNDGSVDMIRKLIEIVGLEGCGGLITEVNGHNIGNGNGEHALRQAAMYGRVDVMDILYTAGARDRLGVALRFAVVKGEEDAVKFLLKRPVYNSRTYVNMRTEKDTSPLLEEYFMTARMLSSTRVLRLLIDASADTTNAPMSLLEIIDDCISRCSTESEKQAMLDKRRLLMRVDAVHAVSWGWPADQPVLPAPRMDAAVREPRLKKTTTSLPQMLHTMRRRKATKSKSKVLLAAQIR